jgi:hypothetical protein
VLKVERDEDCIGAKIGDLKERGILLLYPRPAGVWRAFGPP